MSADEMIDLHAKLAAADAQFRIGIQAISDAMSVLAQMPEGARLLAKLDQKFAHTSGAMQDALRDLMGDMAATIRAQMASRS